MQRSESSLLTLKDWQVAIAEGATPRDLLSPRLRRLDAGAAIASAWIHRLDLAALEPRLQELDAISALMPDRAALLRSHPLFGVPFAIKDNIDAAGLPTTAACPAWRHTAAASASVVQKLLAAGAVLLGKTNLDQFATGLVGTRSPYGVPESALAPGRVSGGSSSGSAVVVARGEVVFALGTDTAGSGRVPAGFNQIVGLKPTPGRVSTAGVLPACRSIDCVSVFALTVDDAAAVLAIIEGEDAADDYSSFAPGPASWASPTRVGVVRQPQLSAEIGYAAAWAQAQDRLADLGAHIVEVDFEPLHEVARLLYDGPWVAERYAAIQPLLDEQPQAMDPTVATIIAQARGWTALEVFRGQYRLRAAQRALVGLWQEMDVLMVPTAPHHPSLDEVAADPIGANSALGTYTNFVNLLGWSALALPAGRTATGLPFGVTFIAPGGADAALVQFGRLWQRQQPLPMGATGRVFSPDEAGLQSLRPATQATLPLAVVGAHLSGLPLNGQLLERGATLRERSQTAPHYHLFELPGARPRKPGLLRCSQGGHAIELEVWDMPVTRIGSFLALIPSPLGLGSIELADGRFVHGFLCERYALEGALDISHHGGWRTYLASL